MTSFVNEGFSRGQLCQPYQLLKIFRYDLGSMMSKSATRSFSDPSLFFDDSAEFNYHSSSSKTKSIHTKTSRSKIQVLLDNMDGQMDQAGIKSRNLGEILQMYFIYVQVANRMF